MKLDHTWEMSNCNGRVYIGYREGWKGPSLLNSNGINFDTHFFTEAAEAPLTLYKIGRFVTHETRKQNSLFFSFSILHKLSCSSYIHLNQYVCLLPPANRRRSCSNGCQAGSGSQRDFEALWSSNEPAEGDRFEGEAAGGGGGGGYGKRRSAGEIGWGR